MKVPSVRPKIRIEALIWMALLLIAPGSQGAALRPVHLECEALVNPLGIETQRPRLSWKLESEANGERQTAYEIAVAGAREELLAGKPGLWQTGRVSLPDTLWIPYRGQSLQPFQQVWWRVRVWSRDNHVSEWSGPAHWTMALVAGGAHRGSWISAPTMTLTAGPLPIFRHEFAVSKPLRRATLLVAGLGFYEASINGHKVGEYALAPAWTNYRQSIRYNVFDVTSLLAPGANAMGVLLGNGPFNVVGGRYSKYTNSFGEPRLWGQLHLQFQDGSVDDVATDSNWKTISGPVTFSDFYGGEDFDARIVPAGWNQAGFDDSQWTRARSTDSPGGQLVADPGPGIKVQQHFATVKVTHPKPGIAVYDLGQNFAGWPHIRVHGKTGDQVRLTPGELLDRSGFISQKSSGGPMYYTYTLAGSGAEQWSPRFTYYGFRYVQVEGAASVDSLEGEFLYLDAPITGTFSSSNETLNRIHSLILAAIKSNLQGVLTDCPHCEKLGWLEQSYLMGPSLLFDFDLRTFLPKVLRDIREAQTRSGLIPDIAPEYVQFGGGFRDSPEWGSAGVVLPWMAWKWYGDAGVIADSYASTKSYVDYLQSKTSNGILPYGLGDWYDIAPGPPGPSKLTPQGVTSTATYYADLRMAAQMARRLGHSLDQDALETRAETERQAFGQTFFHAEDHSYASGSQTALAMPVMTGLTAEADREAVVARLMQSIRNNGNHTTAGDVGYRYVLEALTTHHSSDVVFAMATEKTAPSYGGQLAAGATSLTEAWDANPDSSQNHLMLGHLEEWFYNGLAGLRPLFSERGGFSQIDIDPSPVGDLTGVQVQWESSRGPVAVAWQVKGSEFHLKIKIPPGLESDVYLPTVTHRDVTPAQTTRFVRATQDRLVYHAESGRSEFRVRNYHY